MFNNKQRQKAFLGVVEVVVSLAVLAVNPFQPQNFRATPEDLRSPQLSSVWVGLYDSGGGSVDVSYEAFKATMCVGYDNQIGANDCTYWTDNHLADRYSNAIISSSSAKEELENPLEIRQRVV